MAGKPGMHRKALNPAAVERIRQRIKADRLIDALENHVLADKEMTKSQVSAALGLLKKCVPDLSAIEMSGEMTVKTLAQELAGLNAQSDAAGR